MAELSAQEEALIAGYADQSGQITAQTLAVVERLWASLPRALPPARVATWLQQMIPVIEGSQRAVGSLTDAYIAALARVTNQPVAPSGVPPVLLTDEVMRGARTSEVYLRAINETRYQTTQKPVDEAFRIGGDRVVATAATDLQLARTHAARHAMEQNPKIAGYRRVTHGRCCQLCELAAGRMYHKANLLPIHERCECSVLPIWKGQEPPDPLHLGSPSEEDRGDAFAVHQHGELGPVLTVAGQHFTTEAAHQ